MRETILVVDDEEDVLDLVRYHLSRAGFEVDVASNGAAALNVARQRRPDAIVLDVMLPQMSGTEVFQKLRLEIDTAKIPVLMLTAKGQLSDRLAGLELGVDDYITKPCSRSRSGRVLSQQKQLRDQRPWSAPGSYDDRVQASGDTGGEARTNAKP
jgi:DNA-binding response OmpR family regulator